MPIKKCPYCAVHMSIKCDDSSNVKYYKLYCDKCSIYHRTSCVICKSEILKFANCDLCGYESLCDSCCTTICVLCEKEYHTLCKECNNVINLRIDKNLV